MMEKALFPEIPYKLAACITEMGKKYFQVQRYETFLRWHIRKGEITINDLIKILNICFYWPVWANCWSSGDCNNP